MKETTKIKKSGKYIPIIISELVRQDNVIARAINKLNEQIKENNVRYYQDMFVDKEMEWLKHISVFYDSHPFEPNHLNDLKVGDIVRFDLIIINECDMIPYDTSEDDLFDDLDEVPNLSDKKFDERDYLISKSLYHVQKEGIIHRINKKSEASQRNKTIIKFYIHDVSDNIQKSVCKNITFKHVFELGGILLTPSSYRAKIWIGVD